MRESAKRFYQEMAEMGRPKQGEKPAPSNSSSPSPGKTNLASLLGGSKEKKDKADPSFMQYYEAALAEEKRLAAERDGLREYTKAEELAFWQTVRDYATLSVNDRTAVVRKASALEVDVRRQSARQQQALDDETRRFGEQYALNEIEAQRAAADASLSLGQISKEQRLQLDAQYEQQRYEIQRTYLEARLSLLERDPETNAVEMAKIKNQLLEAEQNYQLRRSEILHDVVTEQGAVWNSFTDLLSGLWDKGISAMMNGTLTWRNAMRAVLSEMAQWFITDYVGKKVKAWLIGEATQTAVTKAGTAERAAVEGVAALKSVALWAWTAGKNIMASAWEAMAAAWKAIVGIPVIGPVLAPVAAAAAFAGVSRLAKNVASAEGGYDIPKGLNPLTQLHEEEMVLPQKYANVLRGLAGGGEGAVSPAPTSVQHITISAVDARSFRDYLKSNSHALAPGLRQLARNFTPVKGR